MEEDSGEDDFGARVIQKATKRKFDYSFSSSSEEEAAQDEDEEGKDSDASADDLKEALFVQPPAPKSITLEGIVPPDTAEHNMENIPIHSKIIAEEEASADDEYTARSFQSLSKQSSGANQPQNEEENNID